jgi:hypothetical protein
MDVTGGIVTGLFFATFFTAIATVILMVRGGPTGETAKVWFIVTGFYFGAGILGGALYGLLRPVQDRYWGQYLTAYLILFLVYGGGTATVLPLLEPDSREVPLRVLLGLWAVICLLLAPLYVRRMME